VISLNDANSRPVNSFHGGNSAYASGTEVNAAQFGQ